MAQLKKPFKRLWRSPQGRTPPPKVTNLAVLGTHQFQGIKQVFEGFNWSSAKVDRECDGAI